MNIRLLGVVCLLCSTFAFTLAVNAQTAVPNVHVPFEFSASGKVLPAGDYSFDAPDLTGVPLIRGVAGNSVAILAIKGSPGTMTGMAKLMFERKGGELFLSALELPDQTFNLPVPVVQLRPRLARLR